MLRFLILCSCFIFFHCSSSSYYTHLRIISLFFEGGEGGSFYFPICACFYRKTIALDVKTTMINSIVYIPSYIIHHIPNIF